MRKFVREATYSLSAGRYMDMLSFHPYTPKAPEENLAGRYGVYAALRADSVFTNALCMGEVGWETQCGHLSLRSRYHPPQRVLQPITGAAYTPRDMVLAKQYGISRYIMFNGASTYIWVNQAHQFSPLYEYDGTPSALYFTAGTAAHLLDGAQHGGVVSADKRLQIHLFARPEYVFAVVWCLEQNKHGTWRMTLPTQPQKVFDGGGSAQPCEGLFTITEIPGYFIFQEMTLASLRTCFQKATFSQKESN
jgi:hypothetical protein